MKKIIFVSAFVLIFFFSLFATLGKNNKLSDLDNVSGIAIDFQNDKIIVTCEIILPLQTEAYASKTKYVKGEGFTVSEALKNASDNTDKRLYTDSVRIYVISDSLADNKLVKDYFMYESANMRAVSVYCDGNAAQMLEPSDTDSAKSVYLSEKIKRLCFDIKKPVPKPSELLKNTLSVKLDKDANPERSDYEI